MKIIINSWLLLLLLTGMACTTARQEVATEPFSENKKEQQEPEQTKLTEDEANEYEYLFIEGLKQKRMGKLQEAAALFSRCLNIDPNSAVSMYEMANIHYANKDLTSASLLLEKAVSIDDSNKWYKLLLARIYQERKQFAEAAVLYEKLYLEEPDNDEYLYIKAMTQSRAGNYQEAIDAYNLLEKKLGLNDQISVAKQQVYLLWEKPEKAFEEINRLIVSNPDEPRYYGLLAEFYQTRGDKENALKNYLKILEIDPDNGFVHFSLAGFYQEEGNFNKAFEHIKSAFLNDEVDAETKIQYYLMQTSDPENSDWTSKQITELLDILHAKYPENNLMYTVYADYMIRQSKLKEARDYLRKYLEKESGEFPVWQQLLFVSNDLQDFETLYTDSKRALELFPDKVVLYALNAVASLKLEKYSEALAVLEKGESLLKGNLSMKIQFKIYKAEANYKLNREEQAFQAFDEVIRLDPDNFMALNNYAYYLSESGKQLDKAENLSSRVIQANPDNPTYLDTHAWVLFKRKNYNQARMFMETALHNGGDENPVLLEHYGDILYMLGERQKALVYWKMASKLGEGSGVLEQKIRESRYIENIQP
ncbi:MAG: tetratricopeptide repeat protein [Mangrovibacterium sp.]